MILQFRVASGAPSDVILDVRSWLYGLASWQELIVTSELVSWKGAFEPPLPPPWPLAIANREGNTIYIRRGKKAAGNDPTQDLI